MSRNTYYVHKREKRSIVALLEKYFTDEDLEEFLTFGKISKFEKIKYFDALERQINQEIFALSEEIRLMVFSILYVIEVKKNKEHQEWVEHGSASETYEEFLSDRYLNLKWNNNENEDILSGWYDLENFEIHIYCDDEKVYELLKTKYQEEPFFVFKRALFEAKNFLNEMKEIERNIIKGKKLKLEIDKLLNS